MTDRARAWSRAHWLIGVLGLVGFLGSGLQMHYGYGHLQGADRATHLSFRSIHIYLLFSSLLNLGVAAGVGRSERPWAALVAACGSVLVLAGPILLGIAFLTEPMVQSLDRSFTRLGVVVCTVGTLLLSVARSSRGRQAGTEDRD